MAGCLKTYSADFFKKNQDSCLSESSARNSNLDSKNGVGREMLQLNKMCDTRTYADTDTSSESEDIDDDVFNNEDRMICRLYRKVIDDMKIEYKLEESKVSNAISKMKEDIHQGHKKGFRRFGGIDFNKPSNRCGYLRRYAVCHTGLVKKAIWQFLLRRNTLCQYARSTNFGKGHIKAVSLGGGPGNDLVGFCCALQEALIDVKELDLKVVDINQGWASVFSSILKRAKNANLGSLSDLLKKIKITTGFMKADLSTDGIFNNDTLSSVLGGADIVLMVKLVSFISDKEAENLIQNVVQSMQEGSLLIFIDQPYDKELFHRISGLDPIYHHYLKYEMSFNPAKYHCPAISAAQAHVGVFEKQFEVTSEDNSSDSDAS